MRAQLGDGAEPDRPMRELGLDRSVRVKRVGHAVDDAGFQDRGCTRLVGRRGLGAPLLNRRSMLRLSFDLVEPGRWGSAACVPSRASIGGPERIEILRLGLRLRADGPASSGTGNRAGTPSMPPPRHRRRGLRRRLSVQARAPRCFAGAAAAPDDAPHHWATAAPLRGRQPPTDRLLAAPFAECSNAAARWRRPTPRPPTVRPDRARVVGPPAPGLRASPAGAAGNSWRRPETGRHRRSRGGDCGSRGSDSGSCRRHCLRYRLLGLGRARGRPCGDPRSEPFRDPAKLGHHRRKSDQDQAARERRGARDDERGAEGELIDRNAESDRGDARRGNHDAQHQQDHRHTPTPQPDRRKEQQARCYGYQRILTPFRSNRNN